MNFHFSLLFPCVLLLLINLSLPRSNAAIVSEESPNEQQKNSSSNDVSLGASEPGNNNKTLGCCCGPCPCNPCPCNPCPCNPCPCNPCPCNPCPCNPCPCNPCPCCPCCPCCCCQKPVGPSSCVGPTKQTQFESNCNLKPAPLPVDPSNPGGSRPQVSGST